MAAEDITDTVWPNPADVPVDLATLAADPVYGDGVYAGPTFESWQYVTLGDATRAHYGASSLVWLAGIAPPVPPAEGAVIADLGSLRSFVGASSTVDDERLQWALDTATEWAYERTYPHKWATPDVQYAVLLLASRLFKRRQSPEGTAGFSGEGFVVRILANDPDVRALIERSLDMCYAGVG